ncbi:MAG TPA: trigger factor [Longimicrobium sp.]|nr:trigger factor [Longimicrobium sp.]
MPENSELRVQVEEPTSWSRRLSITVPGERVRRARQSAAAKLANSVRLPGFRKGKTPASLIERQFGAAIEQETVDKVIQDAYREALAQSNLQPITQPQVGRVEYPGGGADMTFDVEFEVSPTLDLARTGGFAVVRPADEVREEDVAAVLERIRDERGTLSPLPADAHPGYGDQVVVEIAGLDDAEEGAEPEARPYRFELGAGQAIPQVEESILQLVPGEEREFTVAFPDDFPDEAQRGQERRMRIRLVEGQRKELPALDDELARAVGDFESLDALRERVRADLAVEKRRQAEGAVRDALVRQIIEANPFDVPASMVDRYLDFMTGDVTDEHGRRRPRSGDEEARISQMRAILRPQAEASLKRMMVVEHLAERHGLRATTDDVDARVEALAQQHGQSASDVWMQLERSGQMQSLESEITEEKVFAHLLAQNTVTGG